MWRRSLGGRLMEKGLAATVAGRAGGRSRGRGVGRQLDGCALRGANRRSFATANVAVGVLKDSVG